VETYTVFTLQVTISMAEMKFNFVQICCC